MDCLYNAQSETPTHQHVSLGNIQSSSRYSRYSTLVTVMYTHESSPFTQKSNSTKTTPTFSLLSTLQRPVIRHGSVQKSPARSYRDAMKNRSTVTQCSQCDTPNRTPKCQCVSRGASSHGNQRGKEQRQLFHLCAGNTVNRKRQNQTRRLVFLSVPERKIDQETESASIKVELNRLGDVMWTMVW